MYWTKDLDHLTSPIITQLKLQSKPAYQIATTSFLGLLAAILQSAGGFIPVVGMFISPLATFPIILAMLMGVSNGLMGYVLTIFLLLIIQPSELFVFPFTTGLLAIGIGLGLLLFNKRLKVIAFSGLVLSGGICILLYVFQFPILGPFFLELQFSYLIIIYLFSFLYSWGWTEFILLKLLPITSLILGNLNKK